MVHIEQFDPCFGWDSVYSMLMDWVMRVGLPHSVIHSCFGCLKVAVMVLPNNSSHSTFPSCTISSWDRLFGGAAAIARSLIFSGSWAGRCRPAAEQVIHAYIYPEIHTLKQSNPERVSCLKQRASTYKVPCFTGSANNLLNVTLEAPKGSNVTINSNPMNVATPFSRCCSSSHIRSTLGNPPQ